MICPNCKKHFNEGFNFCPWCGSKKLDIKICPNCEYKTYDEEFMFCPECGKKLIDEIEYELQKDEIKEFLRKEEIQKKMNSHTKNISSNTVSAET